MHHISALAAAFTLPIATLLAAPVYADIKAEFVSLDDLPGPSGPITIIVGRAVTPSGSHVTGQSMGGDPAVRWDHSTLDVLHIPPIRMNEAFGMSNDGTVIAGRCHTPNSSAEACFWREGEGLTALGILSGTFFSSQAWDLSGDGNTVVGWARSTDAGPSDFAAFKWTQDEGMVHLGYLGGGTFSQALAVSDDGSVIAGVARTANNIHFAFRWTESTGMVSLGDLPGFQTNSGGRGISGDGSAIVGNAFSMNGQEAFRWTEDQGMIPLGILSLAQGGAPPGFFHSSLATDANHDGSIVVGISSSLGDPTVTSEAFIWDEVNGMRRLKQVLEEEYGLDLSAHAVVEVNDVHTYPDGVLRSLTGLTISFGVIEGFMIRVTRDDFPDCPGDLTGSGSVGVPDLLQLLSCWGAVAPGSACATADLSGSGSVGVPDLLELLSQWGPCP